MAGVGGRAIPSSHARGRGRPRALGIGARHGLGRGKGVGEGVWKGVWKGLGEGVWEGEGVLGMGRGGLRKMRVAVVVVEVVGGATIPRGAR